MISIDIFFNDLKEDKQKELLEAVGVESTKDMNWDLETIPIAVIDIEEEME